MAMFFTDNKFRQQRVTDLVNQSVMIQDEMKRVDAKWKDNDIRAYDYLKKVSKAADYPTPQEYIAAAMNMLPEKEKLEWYRKRDEAVKLSEDMKIAFDVAGGVFALAVLGRLGTTERGLALLGSLVRYSGLRILANVVARGAAELGPLAANAIKLITECFKSSAAEVSAARDAGLVGDAAQEAKLFTEAAESGIAIEKGVGGAAEAAAEGSEAAAEGAQIVGRGMRYFKIAGNTLSVAAALVTVGVLIFDAVEGAKQKTELEKKTLEYLAKRFSIKQGAMRLDQAFTNFLDMTKLIVKEDALNDLVADGTITKEKKEEKMKANVQDMVSGYKKSFTIIEDQTILDQLKSIDTTMNSWTNEDKGLKEIKQWLRDHPADHSEKQ
ncbi:uncharacterized protein EAF01_009003 [Botrytis porri]|uniref:Uncharacterized protein n=1 Tax=Botrytis porri TaxID=87229 RepID=A0A4Z1KJ31_9HELO|nr:uncharacterized protein EAF01_009003 [Botrytis porri]KAF7896600.1 hypothetical protein EAF01_009003 [Botrytis porri]TGO81193.1 hypothetical protein BPOR_1286g00020 [Botrytis porri]